MTGSAPRPGRRLLRRVALGALGAVLALSASAVPAWAHNVLIGSAPAGGATEATVPAAVTLTFDQPVIALGTRVTITGPAGPVHAGSPQVVDNTVRQPIQSGAPAGDYTVTWRVTSVDGHPVTGSLTFTAAQPGGGGSADPAGPAAAPLVARGTAAVIAAGVLIGLVVPFAIAYGRRRRRRPAVGDLES